MLLFRGAMLSRVLRPSICCLVVFSTWNNWQTRCRARPLGSPPVCAVVAAGRSLSLGLWVPGGVSLTIPGSGIKVAALVYIRVVLRLDCVRDQAWQLHLRSLLPKSREKQHNWIPALILLCFLHYCIYGSPLSPPEITSVAEFLFFCHRSPMITSKLSTSPSCYHG